MQRYPFAYEPKQSFVQQVSDWVADVFYEILPESGFEVRDEQIYMAFQLERAYADKQTIFAEAGVGTGKTLVYLLYAICYARYTRKPAIIACADESLIEQLVKPEGDVAKLARHLGLTIDARLGKSPDQYLCLNKLEASRIQEDDSDLFQDIYAELPGFVNLPEALQSFYPYGDRRQYAHLNDEQWSKVSWDSFQDCLVCDKRHRCGQTLSRDHYRKSADLIICSHDFYMEHVWTYEARKREGQLPLLPEHSSVVFDEGHLLEAAAQKALTYKLKHDVFESIMTRLLQGEIREKLAVLIEEVIEQSDLLFLLLERHSRSVPGSNRKEIHHHEELLHAVLRFKAILASIEEELVFESGLHTLDEYQLRIVEEHIEMIQLALGIFMQSSQVVSWVLEEADGIMLVIMPRKVKELLSERVFSQRMPIVFSSATLAVHGSFDYIADNLGILSYLSFSVASPYDYANQMQVVVPHQASADHDFAGKMDAALRLLRATEGSALLLFPSREEMLRFRQAAAIHPAYAGMRMEYEGDREISHLISSFQNDVQSILCAYTLWEGLDVPGPALMNVIIWSLPFPPNDPVFSAMRQDAEHPFEQVDLPYMLLRLRQGMGRLIRSKDDSGIVAILDSRVHTHDTIRSKVKEVLPADVVWKQSIEELDPIVT
ncbi:ATP-dependent DNA helicase [Paenibacillus rigui]|uniref:ATP-dependent helicase n=1 Tax=Paenibacillus rigui TaxID=554312 RepID=A0A229UQA0_9BACL|nr:ATP-dependent DNA helicase [Paenibacillus rigui]OXM85666.1 ATP-dependent helicase [Paenibacillus rigui]